MHIYVCLPPLFFFFFKLLCSCLRSVVHINLMFLIKNFIHFFLEYGSIVLYVRALFWCVIFNLFFLFFFVLQSLVVEQYGKRGIR